MLTLWVAASALGADPCLTPRVLDAKRGLAPAPHVYALSGPAGVGEVGERAARAADKPVYGTPYPRHYNSPNFTVNWLSGSGNLGLAEHVAQVLEQGWVALIEEQGWAVPVSADTFKLWVMLDDTLAGTGFTTTYDSAEYPQGYPVMYLNPDYSVDQSFMDSVAVHELHHAIQYALRDYSGEGAEAWYWEASAQWAAELALPDNDRYAEAAGWYAPTAWYRYDSMEDAHPYGMFLVNAWVDEHGPVSEGMKLTWELGADRPGEDWAILLSDALGIDVSEVWGGFTGAYAAQTLRESAQYEPALVEATVVDGLEGEVAMLGTDYHRVEGTATLTVERLDASRAVVLSVGDRVGEELQVEAGDIVAVTGLAEPTAGYRLVLSESKSGPEDTGDTADTGEDGTSPPGDTDTPGDTGDPALADETASTGGGCGCRTAEPVGGGLLVVALIAWRRQRSMEIDRT